MSYTNGLDKPSNYFTTKLYSGNGGTQSITGLDFQPDWSWLKCRSTAYHHRLFDVVRGAGKNLRSDTSNAEQTVDEGITAFNSDGFSVKQGSTLEYNASGQTYVSWNWKAGTSVSGNTTGSGTAKSYSGSVNTDSGFSIIKYTGNGTSGHTIPHNLTQKPAMIIVKKLTGDNWTVYHHKIASDPATDYIFLNSTAAATDYAGYWNDTEPTSSVFTVGNDGGSNANDVSLIAYCFAEKKGYSKFGSYTGNGNADGTFVYTGFKPAFVLLKNANGTYNWNIQDNKRDPYNPVQGHLAPNNSAAEADSSSYYVDFLSNGFKIRNNLAVWNGSGNTLIYMAFAEHPFVTSTGVPATAR